MSKPLLLVTALLLPMLCGCERQSMLIEPGESIEFRVIATMESDKDIVEIASDTSKRFVLGSKELIAEWVPIGNPTSLCAGNMANAVTRQTGTGKEILVLHTVNDITDAEIESVERTTGGSSSDPTMVTVTDAGALMLLRLTVDHVGRSVAVIADGTVRITPRIVAPVRKTIVLSRETIDKVRAFPSGKN